MNSNNYIKLFANCIPIKGISRSVIYDLQRNTYFFIPNILFEIIELSKNKTLQEIIKHYGTENKEFILEYIDFLYTNELMFWCEKDLLENFPEMNFNHENPFKVVNCIWELQEVDFDKIKDIILQLSELGCNNLQFRFFDTLSINQLENLFVLFEKTMLKNIEILIPYNTALTYENIHILCKNYPRLFNFHVYNAPTYKVHDLVGALISFSPKTINQIDSCGNINPKFFNQSLNQFTEAYNYNSCLYKQISIDINGEIKNCPSMSKSFGNINNISLQEVVDDNDFKSLWYIKKDNIEVCKDCEFRYMCIDCRCFIKDKSNIYSQPSKCKYNPYIGKWEGEKGYTPILES